MKTIAIISQKGGSGKTTLAINLAVTAQILGHQSAIIDLDPQASSKAWHDIREGDSPPVVSAQAARLPEILETARKNDAALAIIDTAPHSETTALIAARAADLILIPCRPAFLDLRSISATSDLVALSKTPAIVILNAVPPRGTLTEEAQAYIKHSKLPVSEASLGQRAAFVHSITTGQSVQEYEPRGKAAQEIQHVYMWICQHARMSTLQKGKKLK